ncbi:MAG: amidohydrolase family protein [Infirmifilum sp.]|uniref:Amidohydrolase-related domain-containing protein n=1 Tax=Infirmifilum uzonense TaxID=1550241 RepID=A0A0F7FHH1_9CREN|nr:amidohydrolase [Infirmifilum uzonense]AKG38175.1 hypothetical protein MA03_01180 [Infirmifilum uzonense]
MTGSIIIRNAEFILTMDGVNGLLRRQSILIKDGVIEAIGDYATIVSAYGQPDDVIDGREKIVMPGLINAHTHIAMTGFRGLAADAGEVIYKVFWPLEKSLTPDVAYRLALLGALEAVKSGVTVIADHYFFMDEIAKAVEEVGIRGFLGHTYMDIDGPFVGSEELRKALDFVDKWKNHELITPVLAPHATDTVHRENLVFLAEKAKNDKLFLHLHLAQTQREFKVVHERTGFTPVKYALHLGLLGGRTIVAHANYVLNEEKALLAHSGSIIAQCPTTYLLSGTRFHAYDYWQLGGNIAIGTDAPCYNDNTDFFEEMRLLIFGQRLLAERVGLWNAYDVLEMSTRSTARLLGLRTGIIKRGFEADLVLLDIKKPHLRPAFNPYALVVYSATTGDVDTVIVKGRIVVRGGRHVGLDEERVIHGGEAAAMSLLRKALNENPELENLLKVKEI